MYQIASNLFKLDEHHANPKVRPRKVGIVMRPKVRDKVLRLKEIEKPEAVINAWHSYCMESWMFRLFVKMGWRK